MCDEISEFCREYHGGRFTDGPFISAGYICETDFFSFSRTGSESAGYVHVSFLLAVGHKPGQDRQDCNKYFFHNPNIVSFEGSPSFMRI